MSAQNFLSGAPYKKDEYQGGRTNFGMYLRDISVSEPFQSGSIKAVLVVSDKDSDAGISFEKVKSQIKLVPEFAVPDQERIAVRKKGSPHIIVLMIPMVGTGNLESLCLQSAYERWDFKAHLDTFVDNTPAKDWSNDKQAKARMQAILATTNKKQPDTGFASHWNAKEEYRIPLNHECFSDLVAFLNGFEALVAD